MAMMKPGFSLMDWNNLARVADLSRGQHSASRQISMEQLRQRKDWCCIRGKVYDFSQYIPYHPGGSDELERGAGDDCTALFDEFHPWVNVDAMFKKCQVGVLVSSLAWTKATVESSEDLGGHFFRVRFDFKDEEFLKQLHEAKEKGIIFHVKIRSKMGPNQRFIERIYTPLVGMTFDPKYSEDKLSILIKRSIKKNRLCLSHAICSSAAAELKFDVQFKPCTIKMGWYIDANTVGLVCAGSGITPALQILSHEVSLGEASTRELFLVWCNRSEAHASLRPELHELLTAMNGRLKLVHLLSRVEDVSASVFQAKHEFEEFEYGRFDDEFLVKRPEALPMPPRGDDKKKVSILMCGTWEFERSVRATMFMAGFSTDALVRIPG